MNYNVRRDAPSKTKEEFVAWLLDETVSMLQRSAGNGEALKGAVFLFLNRAYEAGIPADQITDMLGIGAKSALSRAALGKEDEQSVLNAFDALDGVVEAVYSERRKS